MKNISLIAAALLLSLTAFSEPVSQEEALDRATKFMYSRLQGAKSGSMRLAKRQPRMQSSLIQAGSGTIQSDTGNDASYYVFNIDYDGGFVIVSGDDRTPAILGYADCGHFDADNMPDNMREWLQGYERQIASMAVSDGEQQEYSVHKAPSVKHSVTPLVTTKWDQRDPYNAKIYPREYKAPLTGCVATAMAQVLNYHGQLTGRPESITADIPVYNPNVKGTAKGTVIDWANMQDTYVENAVIETEEQQRQADAVAELMLMCGTSVEMVYNYQMSGASNSDVAGALIKYFGYDGGTHYVQRKDYTQAEWEAMICNELLEGRPVLYGGSTSGQTGHSFVVDGFDGDEMFHINWGWGGLNDGYFLLSICRPDDKSGAGAGSADDGYTIGQDAVIGAQPDAGTVPDGLQLDISEVDANGSTIAFNACNYNEKASVFEAGIGYISEDGTIDYIDSRSQSYPAAQVTKEGGMIYINGTMYRFSFNLGSISSDTCKIVIMSREKGDEKWMTPMNAVNYYIEAVRSSAGIKLRLVEPVKPIPHLELADHLTLNRNTSGSGKQKVEAKIKNTGDEFYGEITLTTRLIDSDISNALKIGATILSEETQTVSFAFSPSVVGEYVATLSYMNADNQNTVLGTDTIFAPAKVRNDVKVSVSLAIENADDSGDHILGNKAHLVTTVKNDTDDDYEGYVVSRLVANGEAFGSWNAGVKQFVAAHDSAVFENDFDVVMGEYYKPMCVVQNLPDNYQNNYEIHEIDWCKATPAVTFYRANGRFQAQAAAASVEVPADVVAVDLAGNSITKAVTPSSNANCLYYLSDNAETPEGLTVNIVKGTHCDSLHIYDDALPFKPIADFTADTVAYTRLFDKGITAIVIDGDTIVNQSWTTICLPFSADHCQLADGTGVDWMRQGSDSLRYDFWLMEYQGDEFNTLFFAPAQELRAYTPYMIAVPGPRISDKPDMTAAPVTFYGGNANLRTTDVNIASSTNYKFVGTTMGVTDSYKTYAITEDGSLCKREAVTAMPFRAYVKAMTNARTSATAPISFMATISVEPENENVLKSGDVNGDGAVNVADISAVISIMAGEDYEDWKAAADVNGDGAVNVADISAIISIMAE